ncbi:hypothetical protein POSPLADRAFT_1108332, partial [Postia placenta MAD-698-R-SB12]
GCMLGIPAFDEPQHDKELYQWRSQLATAMRNDRASAKHSGSAMKVVSRVAHGLSVEDDALENGFSKVVDAMMVDVRAKYDGFVVRRTLGSLDWEGKAISGLPPYAEHILMLKLTGEEYKNLDTIANEAAELNPGGSIAYNSGKPTTLEAGCGLKTPAHRACVLDARPPHHPGGRMRAEDAGTPRSFYLSVRRALLHPSCNAEYKWTPPTSREEWEAIATAKISALITILKYHLEQDARPPLVSVPVEDPPRPQSPSSDTSSDEPAAYEERPANNLAPDPDAQPDPRDAHSKPDKIVVYVAFPSCFDPLLKILQMYGIEYETLTGTMSGRRRAEALHKFMQSDAKGVRVLILSNVGAVGFNIACANILIIIDTLWSAQDDSQLIGRLWRQRQLKLVHVYRLIARNTSDVFLNNISFDKSIMHNAFMGSSRALRRVFDPKYDLDVGDKDLTHEEEPQELPD